MFRVDNILLTVKPYLGRCSQAAHVAVILPSEESKVLTVFLLVIFVDYVGHLEAYSVKTHVNVPKKTINAMFNGTVLLSRKSEHILLFPQSKTMFLIQ